MEGDNTVEFKMFFGASPKIFEFAKQLRKNETIAEKLLWERLNKNQVLRLRFRRQHPLKYFIADFYCHKVKLVIELDGGIHNAPKQFEYDQNRDYEMNELGLTILRFKNEEVLENIEIVVAKIIEVIKSPL
jgi:very-short-patch-repair endonuclease